MAHLVDTHISLSPQNIPHVKPSGWFVLSSKELNIETYTFLKIVCDLQKIGALTIYNEALDPQLTEEGDLSFDENGGVNTSTKSLDVWYEIDLDKTKEKLKQLDQEVGSEGQLREIEYFNSAPETTVDDFVVFTDQTVTYKGVLMEMPPQEMHMLAVLLMNEGKLTNYTDIEDSVLGADSRPVSRDRMRRIVSDLNKKLDDLLGYKPILSVETRGWSLTLSGS